jgi:hypothetical protein
MNIYNYLANLQQAKFRLCRISSTGNGEQKQNMALVDFWSLELASTRHLWKTFINIYPLNIVDFYPFNYGKKSTIYQHLSKDLNLATWGSPRRSDFFFWMSDMNDIEFFNPGTSRCAKLSNLELENWTHGLSMFIPRISDMTRIWENMRES